MHIPQKLWCEKNKISVYMADLNAWIDVQLRKPFAQVAPTDETVKAFDPLYTGRGEGFDIPARILEIYDRGQRGIEGRGTGIRRTVTWRFTNSLPKRLVEQMMNKIKRAVHRRHKLNYRYAYELRNIETGELMVYYTNINSPWMVRLSKTKKWLEDQEELRLQGAQIDRPNTKWVFSKISVY